MHLQCEVVQLWSSFSTSSATRPSLDLVGLNYFPNAYTVEDHAYQRPAQHMQRSTKGVCILGWAWEYIPSKLTAIGATHRPHPTLRNIGHVSLQSEKHHLRACMYISHSLLLHTHTPSRVPDTHDYFMLLWNRIILQVLVRKRTGIVLPPAHLYSF